MILDFCTTAMSRPEIVDKTYFSFSKNLKGINLKECRLFINIDPLPSKVDRIEVTKIAQKYFKEVHPNYPKVPNFTTALNWVWSQADNKYIFHLEDDWELTEEISIDNLMKPFKKHPKLMQVALRAYKYKYVSCVLSPGIFHKRFYKAVAGKLNEKINPEIQLRGKNFGIEMPGKEFNISWQGKIVVYPKKIIILDIGRKWLKKSKFKKPDKKGHFTTWETKK